MLDYFRTYFSDTSLCQLLSCLCILGDQFNFLTNCIDLSLI
uniref:Uncharacterized protein n=1 Tax=Arundo donax TaxID=35708 RepID=A0A0A8YKL2_ARUDO